MMTNSRLFAFEQLKKSTQEGAFFLEGKRRIRLRLQ